MRGMRILLILWASMLLAYGGGTLTSSNLTHEEAVAEGYEYQLTAAGTFDSQTVTVKFWNATLGAFSGNTTLTSASTSARVIATGPRIQFAVAGGSPTIAVQGLRLPLPNNRSTISAPAIWVTYASGEIAPFKPATDTNAARGDALESAWASCLATTGAETINLYPGNFLIDKSTSTIGGIVAQFEIEAGLTVRLNGARLYKPIDVVTTASAMFSMATSGVNDWRILGPGVIEGGATIAEYETTTMASQTTGYGSEIGINTNTNRHFQIHNITWRYFRGVALQFNQTSYTGHGTSLNANLRLSSGMVTNCNVDYNNIGFQQSGLAEFAAFTGCTFNNNLTAFASYGGNVRFTACEFSGNSNYAYRQYNSGGGNYGKHIFSGCTMAHNVNFAISVAASMHGGAFFSGCTFGADSTSSNKIESLGGGLTLTGCYVESPFYASATPTGMNAMIGCFIAGTYTAVTDLAVAEKAQWRFKENYTLTGAWAENN